MDCGGGAKHDRPQRQAKTLDNARSKDSENMPKQEEMSRLTVGRRHDGITKPASERLRDASVAVDRELATAKHGDGRDGRVAGYSL